MFVSEILKNKQHYTKAFPYLCTLTQKQLVLLLSHLVTAEEAEEQLACIIEKEYESAPKAPVPQKVQDTQYKTYPIRVRSTGEIIRPVGRRPKHDTRILEVDTLEEAMQLARRKTRK